MSSIFRLFNWYKYQLPSTHILRINPPLLLRDLRSARCRLKHFRCVFGIPCKKSSDFGRFSRVLEKKNPCYYAIRQQGGGVLRIWVDILFWGGSPNENRPKWSIQAKGCTSPFTRAFETAVVISKVFGDIPLHPCVTEFITVHNK